MMPFTLICILVMLVLLAITGPCAWLIYRYTRPKTEPLKAMLKWEAGIVGLLLIGMLASAFWPTGCAHPMPDLSSNPPACSSGTVAVGGSTALQSLMSALATHYMQQCSQAHITVVESTSQNNISKSEAGLDGAEDGSLQIGTSDTFATADKSDLVDHEIAASVFVVMVNRSVGLTNLTTGQIQGIYSGKYTNWQELGGPDMPIKPLSRSSGSGTRFTFDSYILGSHELVSQSMLMKDTPTMIAGVQSTKGAIGYADLHDVDVNLQSLIQVSIDGVPASTVTALNNSYKFWTLEHMYTKGQGNVLENDFINYMGTSEARGIIEGFSFINIHNVPSNVLSARCPGNEA